MFAAPDAWQPAQPPPNPGAPPGSGQPLPAVAPISTTERECEFFVIGEENQCLQVYLQPGQTVTGRKGSLVFRGGRIKERAEPGTRRSFLQLLTPANGIQLCTWFNSGALPSYVGFSSPLSGKILDLDSKKVGPMLVASECLLCVTADNTIEAKPRQIPEEGGGNGGSGRQAGAQLHHVRGTGHCFLTVAGVGVVKKLREEEVLMVEESHLVGCSMSCTMKRIPNKTPWGMDLFGGQCQLEVIGPGTVLIQCSSTMKLGSALCTPDFIRRGQLVATNPSRMLVVMSCMITLCTILFLIGVIIETLLEDDLVAPVQE